MPKNTFLFIFLIAILALLTISLLVNHSNNHKKIVKLHHSFSAATDSLHTIEKNYEALYLRYSKSLKALENTSLELRNFKVQMDSVMSIHTSDLRSLNDSLLIIIQKQDTITKSIRSNNQFRLQ
ncbi:hypothetical protein LVD15_18975 [Fulvivirga maritima]|uniref:hypothetical protein n=1 Tax=Fulvivirga maritima TaxID=2904247 RepID=UPI001F3B9215|nr:hypothetical protein [Fulvivirga maritima]UII25369.1 hypothetical protein LVD15_18975 [Fulvivirga maritima]